MPIDERSISLPEQWAKDAQTVIPAPPVPGIAYRNTAITPEQWAHGQDYSRVADSAQWNQMFWTMSGLLKFAEQYGVMPYSPFTDYPEHAFCLGMDGLLYQALQASGPESGGAQPTTEKAYWKNAFSREIALIYPSAFQTFYEQTPPKGWKVRNGAVLDDAESQFPDLWAALQNPANAWKVKTLAQWTALSTAAGGVGGVPFFVLDQAAKTIKLPDTRGDYERGAGSTYLSAVGAWHGDAIRNIVGTAGQIATATTTVPPRADGVLYTFGVSGTSKPGLYTTSGMNSEFGIDASRMVPTATENRTRTFAVLPCVYVGGI